MVLKRNILKLKINIYINKLKFKKNYINILIKKKIISFFIIISFLFLLNIINLVVFLINIKSIILYYLLYYTYHSCFSFRIYFKNIMQFLNSRTIKFFNDPHFQNSSFFDWCLFVIASLLVNHII